MLAVTPLAYMLQTVPPIPALPEEKYVKSSGIYDEEVRHNKSEFNAKTKSIQPLSEQEEINCRPLEDISAPDIDTALREALTNPTFIFITVGFTVCGFHVGFITTHFPAYLVSLHFLSFTKHKYISNSKDKTDSKTTESIPRWQVRKKVTPIEYYYKSNTLFFLQLGRSLFLEYVQ